MRKTRTGLAGAEENGVGAGAEVELHGDTEHDAASAGVGLVERDGRAAVYAAKDDTMAR